MSTSTHLIPNGVTSRSLLFKASLKATFHYAIQLAIWSQISSEPVCDQVRAISRHVEIARTCVRQVGNQVCDQLVSWIAR